MEYRLVDNTCIASDPGIKHTHRRIRDVENERGCMHACMYLCASIRVYLINERGNCGCWRNEMEWDGIDGIDVRVM